MIETLLHRDIVTGYITFWRQNKFGAALFGAVCFGAVFTDLKIPHTPRGAPIYFFLSPELTLTLTL